MLLLSAYLNLFYGLRRQSYKFFFTLQPFSSTFYILLGEMGDFCPFGLRCFPVWRGCSNFLRLVLLHGIVLLLLLLGVLRGSLALLQWFLHALGLLVLSPCDMPAVTACQFVYFIIK